jgi:hypothetical protein
VKNFGFHRVLLRAGIMTVIAAMLFLFPIAALPQTTEPPAKPLPKPITTKVALPTPKPSPAPAGGTTTPAQAAPKLAAPPTVGPGRGATPEPRNATPGARPTGGYPDVRSPARPTGNSPEPGRTPGSTPPRIPSGRSVDRFTRSRNGAEIHRAPSGRIGLVRAHGMDIHYGPARSRTIVRERPDHTLLVSNRYNNGYRQVPYSYRRAEFVQRTYVANGRVYSRIYQPYRLGGVATYVYAPAYYYPAPTYVWATDPWGRPVAYTWGWMGDPWYGYYGGYFTPYPVYPSPSLWLTDYLMAQTLQAAYQERADELANSQTYSAPLPPAVKQQIADEVNRQITLESSEAAAGSQNVPDPGSSGVERMLGDAKVRVFVVSSPLFVQSSVGDCYITEGDVLGLMPAAHPDPSTANLTVMARKGNSCPLGSTVTVYVEDLQEMQNHMRETIDRGLGDLQRTQGRNGIPAAPSAALQPITQTGYAAIEPPRDPNVPAELSAQNKEGDQVIRETLSQAEPVDRSSAEPRLALGQTEEQVRAIVGEPPQDIYDSGTQRIFFFSKGIVTFTDGKVTKIQE